MLAAAAYADFTNSGIKLFQTGHLAMETLLSLTSKRAGDWFKEELRLLGGLDHIVDKGILEILFLKYAKITKSKMFDFPNISFLCSRIEKMIYSLFFFNAQFYDKLLGNITDKSLRVGLKVH